LISFSGCVIIISHDRYFMDRVVDRLFVFKANGKIASFQGNYTEYSDILKTKNTVQIQVPSTKSDKTLSLNEQEPKHKLTNKRTNKEREELKKIEKEIDRLETEKAQLSEMFSGDKQSKEAYADAGKKLKVISEELDQKLERWEEFSDRL
jgi:ATP-binding cassette subfamily F protein uup